MAEHENHVHLDDSGVYRVGETRVSLDSVVISYKQGHSPHTIQDQYGSLTLEEVNEAIAYYIANKRMVDEYLARQEILWQQLREELEQNPSPVVQRLRALRDAQAMNPS